MSTSAQEYIALNIEFQALEQSVSSIGTKCFRLWYEVFQALEQSVSSFGTKCFKHWNKVFQALEQSVSSRGLFLKHVSPCQPSTYHFSNNSYSLITSEVGKDLAYFLALFPDFPYFRFLYQFIDYSRSPINNGDYSKNAVIPTFLSDSSGIGCVHPRGTSYSGGID